MIEIRALTPEDWPAVEAIYAEGIATQQATFETVTPTWAEFDAGKLTSHRIVATDGRACAGVGRPLPDVGASVLSRGRRELRLRRGSRPRIAASVGRSWMR